MWFVQDNTGLGVTFDLASLLTWHHFGMHPVKGKFVQGLWITDTRKEGNDSRHLYLKHSLGLIGSLGVYACVCVVGSVFMFTTLML